MIPARVLNEIERQSLEALDRRTTVAVEPDLVIELVASFREAGRCCLDCGESRAAHTTSAKCYGFKEGAR